MSEESRVYGCIVGASTADWYGLYPLNHAAVEALPAEDEHPPLSRGMLAVQMDSGQQVRPAAFLPGSGWHREVVRQSAVQLLA